VHTLAHEAHRRGTRPEPVRLYPCLLGTVTGVLGKLLEFLGLDSQFLPYEHDRLSYPLLPICIFHRVDHCHTFPFLMPSISMTHQTRQLVCTRALWRSSPHLSGMMRVHATGAILLYAVSAVYATTLCGVRLLDPAWEHFMACIFLSRSVAHVGQIP